LVELKENQASNILGYLALGAIAGAVIYAIARPSPAAAAVLPAPPPLPSPEPPVPVPTPPPVITPPTPEPPPVVAPPPTPAPPACTVDTTEDFDRLEAWAIENNIGVVYLPATTTPPLPERSELAQAFVRARPRGGLPIVVITSDSSFWTYETGQPVAAPQIRDTYCTFKPSAAVSGVRWLH
jgi:hypothetical protein